MHGGEGHGDDATDGNDYPLVAMPLKLQVCPLLPFEDTAADADAGAFRQVQFRRLQVDKLLVVGTGGVPLEEFLSWDLSALFE